MKYFESEDERIYAYELDESQASLIQAARDKGWQEMTLEEAKVHLASLQSKSIPQAVSKAQAVLSLSRANIWPAFEAYLKADDTSLEHKLAWDNITEVRRNSRMLVEIAQILGLTDKQVDDLFIAADQIKI